MIRELDHRLDAGLHQRLQDHLPYHHYVAKLMPIANAGCLYDGYQSDLDHGSSRLRSYAHPDRKTA